MILRICLRGTIQTMLEAEIEHELGYAKHSMKDKKADIYDKPDRKLKQTIKKVYEDKITLSDR